MITQFKENEVRETGVVNNGMFEQVKRLFNSNQKELAGEYAISLIELALTGEYSSDDFTIQLLMDNHSIIANRNINKYEKAVEAKRNAQIENLQLYEIAEMLENGATQTIIANTLGEKITTINYRVKVLREKYQDIIEEVRNTKNTKNTKNTNDDNVNVNDNVNDNVTSSSPSSKSWGAAPNPLPGDKEEKFKF